MDRQIGSRLILLAAILTMIGLAATSDVSRIVLLVVAIPAAFHVAGAILLGAPYAAVQKAEGNHLRWRRLLDFFEHSSIMSWIDLLLLWATSSIAYMGLVEGVGLVYKVLFGIALVAGLTTALQDLYLSEESDRVQKDWQEHPHS